MRKPTGWYVYIIIWVLMGCFALWNYHLNHDVMEFVKGSGVGALLSIYWLLQRVVTSEANY